MIPQPFAFLESSFGLKMGFDTFICPHLPLRHLFARRFTLTYMIQVDQAWTGTIPASNDAFLLS